MAFYINHRPPAVAAGTNWTDTENDSVTMSDALVFARQNVLADSVAMSDALIFDRAIVISDSVTMSDSVKFDRAIVINDSVTMSDGIAAERGISQAINDSVTMSDAAPTIESGKGATINDSVTMSDAALIFDRLLVLADTAALADSLSSQSDIRRSLGGADVLSMSDTVALGQMHVLNDSVTMSDLADPVKTSGGGAAPPITIQTFLVGASGRTRATGSRGASTLTGTMAKTILVGNDGQTRATGTSGRTT